LKKIAEVKKETLKKKRKKEKIVFKAILLGPGGRCQSVKIN